MLQKDNVYYYMIYVHRWRWNRNFYFRPNINQRNSEILKDVEAALKNRP